ncbi:MAG: hypothetical protein ACOZAO_00920 [Patescibacteria group bacterium]
MRQGNLLIITALLIIGVVVAITGGIYYVKNIKPAPIPTTQQVKLTTEQPKAKIKKDNPNSLIGRNTREITEAIGAPNESTASVKLNKAIWVYLTNEISKDAIFVYLHDTDVINIKEARFEGNFDKETWLLTPYFE